MVNMLPLFLSLLISLIIATLPFNSIAKVKSNNSEQTYNVAIRNGDVGTKIIFDELAKHFNIKFKYRYHDQFSGVLSDLKTNKSDFTANVTYSKERAKYLDVSRPTNIEYTYLYTRDDFTEHYAAKDVKVVAIANQLIFKSYINDLYPNIRIVTFSDYNQAKKMIKSGEVDGVIDNISKLKLFLDAGFEAQILNDKLPIQPVGIASGKNRHTDLIRKMVDYLHTPEMQKQIREKMERYQFNLRQGALRRKLVKLGIDSSVPIRVKFENVIQLSEYGENGKLTGIGPDILTSICKVLALKCVVVSTKDEPWENMYNDLLAKKIDVLSPITISTKRAEHMYFSKGYFSLEAIVVKRTGYKNNVYKRVSEMVTEKISVINGDYYDQLLTNMLPGQKLYRMESREKQISALLKGEVDYVVLNLQNYNKMIMDDVADFSSEEDQSIGVFHRSSTGFGFPKTEKGYKLSVLFNSALNLIDVPFIVNKYDANPDWRSVTHREKSVNILILVILITSVVFMSLVVWFVYRQAITDNLTKLKNRRALYQKFSRGLSKDRTLVYIDVNKFKLINDTYGHNAGDAVLQQLSQLILKYWPGQSFRIGGDEFVLIAKLDQQKCDDVLSHLKIFQVDLGDDNTIEVNTSCGISNNRKFFMSIDQVLHLADKKMYQVKSG